MEVTRETAQWRLFTWPWSGFQTQVRDHEHYEWAKSTWLKWGLTLRQAKLVEIKMDAKFAGKKKRNVWNDQEEREIMLGGILDVLDLA